MALSLRVLFDPDFTHLFFHDGNYYVGHILVAIGALMTVAGILGCIGVLAENKLITRQSSSSKLSFFLPIVFRFHGDFSDY
jgi:hypothetical protein